jgi:hypothetical protein
MSKKYLLINLDEIELAKILDFNIFIQEYVYLRRKTFKRKELDASENNRCHSRDYIINMILENNKINLTEKQLASLTELIETKWEVLKKIEKSI